MDLALLIKVIIYSVVALFVAIISWTFGLDFDTSLEWIKEHVEYVTCGTTGFGSLLISHKYLVIGLDVSDIVVREGLVFGNLFGTILITFFFTRWLKSKWPDEPKEPPVDSQGEQI